MIMNAFKFLIIFIEMCLVSFNSKCVIIVFNLEIVGSDNGLSPIRRQAIIWTNDGLTTDAYMRPSASMSDSFSENLKLCKDR